MEPVCAYLPQVLPPSPAEHDGVSVPPPDIRSMVDKAARFVASNKPRLEKIITETAGMRRFTFLAAADPYHAYYQQRLSEFRAQYAWPAYEETGPQWGPLTIYDSYIEFLNKCEENDWARETVVDSPITGELIAARKMSQHMQDPKYVEQKEALFAKIREATRAQDDQISETIAELARKRPDLFGTPQEEFCDAVVDEIIPYSVSDEPERKRRKFDASLLDSEDEFLADNPGKPDCINVFAEQTMDLLKISVDSLSESVGSFKEKIAREINVPANKLLLELLWMPGFFKDDLSLAYYNVYGGDLISLSW